MVCVSWRNTDGNVYHEAGKVAPARRRSLNAWVSTTGIIGVSILLSLPFGSPRPFSDPNNSDRETKGFAFPFASAVESIQARRGGGNLGVVTALPSPSPHKSLQPCRRQRSRPFWPSPSARARVGIGQQV